MSENPFASPTQTDGPTFNAPKKPNAPTATMAFTVVTLILGIMGLFGVCMGIAGLLMNDFVVGQAIENLPEDDPQRIMQEKMQEAQQGMLIPNIVVQVSNLFVAGLLTMGSILTLMRKVAGPGLLVKAFLLAILFNLLRMVVTIVMQLQMKPAMMEAMQSVPGGDAAAGIFEASFMIGIVIGALVGVGLIIYYFFAYRHFISDRAKQYFATFQ